MANSTNGGVFGGVFGNSGKQNHERKEQQCPECRDSGKIAIHGYIPCVACGGTGKYQPYERRRCKYCAEPGRCACAKDKAFGYVTQRKEGFFVTCVVCKQEIGPFSTRDEGAEKWNGAAIGKRWKTVKNELRQVDCNCDHGWFRIGLPVSECRECHGHGQLFVKLESRPCPRCARQAARRAACEAMQNRLSGESQRALDRVVVAAR